jgi:predicted DNA-binding transcriptional regulator YafY
MRYHATRPPLRRMKVIDQALRAGRWPTDKSLAAELEADPRTIRRDLEFMRNQLQAPIKFSRARRGYYYSEQTYRLPFLQLSEGELISLFLAERMMQQFRGTPFEADLRRAIAKLDEMLPDGVSVRLDDIADFLSVLPATETRYDPKIFCALTSAVVCGRQLELRYWSASRNEETRRRFDPYDVSLVSDGWYTVGHCHLRQDTRMFAIQRVQSVRETGEGFVRPSGFRIAEFLKGSFRAVRGDGDYHVVLRFRSDVARRFAEKQWHASQVLEAQTDGTLIARMQVSSLVEIKRWVMWWGIDCEVLEPAELRDLITREAREMLGRSEKDRPLDRQAVPDAVVDQTKARRVSGGKSRK